MKMKLILMVLALAVFAGPVQADYRLVFITSTNPGTQWMNDIEEFNAYVQALADVAGIGYDYAIEDQVGLKWNVLGSTSLVDARDNTGTNPLVDGVGCPIYLVDGTTKVADDYIDLWDGSIDHIIDQDEYGNTKVSWPHTGTKPDGTASNYVNTHGGPLDALDNIAQGNGGSTTDWIWRQWTARPPTQKLPLYAISEVIIPEPATIGLLGMGALALIRRKRN